MGVLVRGRRQVPKLRLCSQESGPVKAVYWWFLRILAVAFGTSKRALISLGTTLLGS
jgi:hypothetical protein